MIVKYARMLAEQDAPPLQVGIQFVQIGNEKGAKDLLDSLDNDLQQKHNLDRDVSLAYFLLVLSGWGSANDDKQMVDTVPWVDGDEERLHEKILLGGILKRLDNDEEQKAKTT